MPNYILIIDFFNRDDYDWFGNGTVQLKKSQRAPFIYKINNTTEEEIKIRLVKEFKPLVALMAKYGFISKLSGSELSNTIKKSFEKILPGWKVSFNGNITKLPYASPIQFFESIVDNLNEGIIPVNYYIIECYCDDAIPLHDINFKPLMEKFSRYLSFNNYSYISYDIIRSE